MRNTVYRSLAFTLAALSLGACASARRQMGDPYHNAALRDRVLVDSSAFEPAVVLRGVEEGFNDDPGNRIYLRSMVEKATADVRHSFIVSDHYQGAMRGWEHALGQQGEQLVVEHDPYPSNFCSYLEGNCQNTEFVDVVIPDSVLRAHSDGYALRIAGIRGDTLRVRVSAKQIRSQLAAVDAVRIHITASR